MMGRSADIAADAHELTFTCDRLAAIEDRQQQIRQRWKEMLDVETVMEAPKLVDKDGFINLDDMERDWLALQKLQEEAALLDVKIAKAKEALAARMRTVGADGFTIGGVPRATFKANGTFASKAFREDHQAVFAAYQIPTTKLDMEALKRDKPELVKQYTPRRWLDVKPKRS